MLPLQSSGLDLLAYPWQADGVCHKIWLVGHLCRHWASSSSCSYHWHALCFLQCWVFLSLPTALLAKSFYVRASLTCLLRSWTSFLWSICTAFDWCTFVCQRNALDHDLNFQRTLLYCFLSSNVHIKIVLEYKNQDWFWWFLLLPAHFPHSGKQSALQV